MTDELCDRLRDRAYSGKAEDTLSLDAVAEITRLREIVDEQRKSIVAYADKTGCLEKLVRALRDVNAQLDSPAWNDVMYRPRYERAERTIVNMRDRKSVV